MNTIIVLEGYLISYLKPVVFKTHGKYYFQKRKMKMHPGT